MSREPGTIVLDARSKEKYDLLHVKGAINLSFPDIDRREPEEDPAGQGRPHPDLLQQQLQATPRRRSRRRCRRASLNLSTYIALYNYGYRNVYELGPQVDPKDSKLPLVSKK